MSPSPLNLIGTVSPFCLLAFSQALRDLRRGAALDVWIQDPHVIGDIRRLVIRSGHRIAAVHQEGDCYRIRVEKQDERRGSKEAK